MHNVHCIQQLHAASTTITTNHGAALGLEECTMQQSLQLTQRQGLEGIRIVCPCASCNDCCIVHFTSASADPRLVVMVVGVACCCCILLQLALMLFMTFAPCTLTFAPCACGGCHRQLRTYAGGVDQLFAQILHLHTWWLHPLQLAPVVFFLPPIHWCRYQTYARATCTVWCFLVVVVVVDVCVCDGGGCSYGVV